MRTWVRWSAWLCLCLMFWAAGVESTHNHPNPNDAVTCSICVVAHSASPAFASAVDAPYFEAVGLAKQEDVIAKAEFAISYAGIRGPPVL